MPELREEKVQCESCDSHVPISQAHKKVYPGYVAKVNLYFCGEC